MFNLLTRHQKQTKRIKQIGLASDGMAEPAGGAEAKNMRRSPLS